MANFSTHLVGATAVGVVSTSFLAATGLLPLHGVAAGVGVVALGGIFPDVDSDYSDSIELVFNLLGVALGVPLMVALLPSWGLLAALGGLAAGFALVRYGLVIPFRELTRHRGVFHSVPMALLLGFAVRGIAGLGMGNSPVESWLFAGLFVAGFVTHLVLDETYSVDLANRYLKRSFGTALKLFERDRAASYVAVYGLLGLAVILLPSPAPLIAAIGELDIQLFPPSDAIAALLARVGDAAGR